MTNTNKEAVSPDTAASTLNNNQATILGMEIKGSEEELKKFSLINNIGFRRNPKRAHLITSRVIGKHIPVKPSVLSTVTGDIAESSGLLPGSNIVVLGYCETATNLAAVFGDWLECPVVHTTRYPSPNSVSLLGFKEEHSHATSHVLTPRDQSLVSDPSKVLVLVDDEVSTGKTIMNTIEELEKIVHRDSYHVLTLTDARGPEHLALMDKFEKDNGLNIEVTSFTKVEITVPKNAPEVLSEYIKGKTADGSNKGNQLPMIKDEADIISYEVTLSDKCLHLREGATMEARMTQFMELLDFLGESGIVENSMNIASGNGKTLVLGMEEDTYPAFCVAEMLEIASCDVEFSSTTLSPAFTDDSDGYPLKEGLTYSEGSKYAHNVPYLKYAEIIVVGESIEEMNKLMDSDIILRTPMVTKILVNRT